ncbi:MAG: thermostable hemolysin [Pseudomonadota bacterium]
MGAGSGALPQTNVNRDALLLKLLNPAPQFQLLGPAAVGRDEIENYIKERYLASYQARVTNFCPLLISMQCLGEHSGAAGLRPAGNARLYLEQYLDVPVEQAMSAVLGTEIKRPAIVEVCNLVAQRKGASHLLFLLFTTVLYQAGYEWIVFTATKALRNNLEKVGFPVHVIAEASPANLTPAAMRDWGDYYKTEPVVVAGRLEDAMKIILGRTLLRKVMRLYRADIDAMVAQLGGE